MNRNKIKPIKRAKTGQTKGGYYERKTACSRLGIHFIDDEDGYPTKIMVEPKGGGCKASIEAISRLVTLSFESNIDEFGIIEQLKEVICKECRAEIKSGKKDISLSCAQAIGSAIEEHMKANGVFEQSKTTKEPLIEIVSKTKTEEKETKEEKKKEE